MASRFCVFDTGSVVYRSWQNVAEAQIAPKIASKAGQPVRP